MQYVLTFDGMDGTSGVLPLLNKSMDNLPHTDILYVEQAKGRSALPLYDVNVMCLVSNPVPGLKCEPVDVVVERLGCSGYFSIYKHSDIPCHPAPDHFVAEREAIVSDYNKTLSQPQMADLLSQRVSEKYQESLCYDDALAAFKDGEWQLPEAEWDHGIRNVSPSTQGAKIAKMLKQFGDMPAALDRAVHLVTTLNGANEGCVTLRRVGALFLALDEQSPIQREDFLSALRQSSPIPYVRPKWVLEAIRLAVQAKGDRTKVERVVRTLIRQFDSACFQGQFHQSIIAMADTLEGIGALSEPLLEAFTLWGERRHKRTPDETPLEPILKRLAA